MQIWKAAPDMRRVDVWLFDQFSNHCLANTVEPLRAANSLARKGLYAWRYLSLDGAPVVSSSGLPVTPQAAMDARAAGDVLAVMPSYGFRDHATPPVIRTLRAAARRYGRVAGLDTGAWLLAAAGLLDGRRATIHWDEIDAMAAAFPRVEVVSDRHVADGDRLSCGGVSTAFELTLEVIRRDHGQGLALEVAELFMVGERPIHAAPDLVAQAVARMRRRLAQPIPVGVLAAELGLTRKALERLFRRRLGQTPREVARGLRLREARRLAETGLLPVADIAALCGYGDPAALTRAFRSAFGMTPSECRRNPGQPARAANR